MRVLIVDDETTLTKVLTKKLEPHFAVDVAHDGEEGSFLGCTNNYDLAIIDYHLPHRRGPEVCQDIRLTGKNYPILMLSMERETNKKIELLNLGADDYMTKPFSYEELYARIKAMLRRPQPVVKTILRIDDLTLNTIAHSVDRGGAKINLTKKEFMLLEYLMRNQNQILSRGTLMEHVWDMNADAFSNTIEMHILTLRRKIDGPGKSRLIHTIVGRGYKLTLM